MRFLNRSGVCYHLCFFFVLSFVRSLRGWPPQIKSNPFEESKNMIGKYLTNTICVWMFNMWVWAKVEFGWRVCWWPLPHIPLHCRGGGLRLPSPKWTFPHRGDFSPLQWETTNWQFTNLCYILIPSEYFVLTSPNILRFWDFGQTWSKVEVIHLIFEYVLSPSPKYKPPVWNSESFQVDKLKT